MGISQSVPSLWLGTPICTLSHISAPWQATCAEPQNYHKAPRHSRVARTHCPSRAMVPRLSRELNCRQAPRTRSGMERPMDLILIILILLLLFGGGFGYRRNSADNSDPLPALRPRRDLTPLHPSRNPADPDSHGQPRLAPRSILSAAQRRPGPRGAIPSGRVRLA